MFIGFTVTPLLTRRGVWRSKDVMKKKTLKKMLRICELQDICRSRIEAHVKALNDAVPMYGEQYVDFQHERITTNRAIITRLENYYQKLKLNL